MGNLAHTGAEYAIAGSVTAHEFCPHHWYDPRLHPRLADLFTIDIRDW
jgi:hypothetical protein